MSKLFDTLEQIRSNERNSLHPAPDTAQSEQPKSRKKILAVTIVLCAVVTGLLYWEDIPLFNQSGSLSKKEPVEKQSTLKTSLAQIAQQKPHIDNRKKSNRSLPVSDYAKTNKFNSQALQAWHKTLQKPTLPRSERATIFNNIGSYYIFNQQHWKGLAYLDKALAIEPANPVFLINFGIALTELGMMELSTQYFQQARQIAPDHPALIENLELLKKTNLMPMAFNKLFNG